MGEGSDCLCYHLTLWVLDLNKDQFTTMLSLYTYLHGCRVTCCSTCKLWWWWWGLWRRKQIFLTVWCSVWLPKGLHQYHHYHVLDQIVISKTKITSIKYFTRIKDRLQMWLTSSLRMYWMIHILWVANDVFCRCVCCW